jgi:hypothetical protein
VKTKQAIETPINPWDGEVVGVERNTTLCSHGGYRQSAMSWFPTPISYNDSINPYTAPTKTDDRQRASADQIPEWAAICGFLAMIVWSIWLG